MNVLMKLLKDEDGAIIAAEYLLLGSIVAIGAVAGMVEIRDSIKNEYQDLGNQIKEVRKINKTEFKTQEKQTQSQIVVNQLGN